MLIGMPEPRSTPPPGATSSCRAWSAHAAELARRTACELAVLPDTPATRSQVLHDGVELLRPGVHASPASLRTMADRAVAIGCALGGDLRGDHVIAGSSAAWVHLGGRPPSRIFLVTLARPEHLAGVRMRQAPLPLADVEVIGGCPVTAPERTALDLLRFAEDDPSADPAGLVLELVRTGHARAAAIDERLDALERRPHLRRARQRWARIRAALPETRRPVSAG